MTPGPSLGMAFQRTFQASTGLGAGFVVR
ncbi:hypothetical protein AGR5A_pa30134 [Agrobacterium genomosp. 5 str. CFBP 6626]|nr:hypothetical protein AGR5A_pa30134 [Agrobacterium genomosp. 5 str. CFBP 6626]